VRAFFSIKPGGMLRRSFLSQTPSPSCRGRRIIWQFRRDNWLVGPAKDKPRLQILCGYLDPCCFAWTTLIDMPWKITSIGLGISVTINETRYQLMVAELVEERDGPSGFLKVKV
jgi:hypothetical protein